MIKKISSDPCNVRGLYNQKKMCDLAVRLTRFSIWLKDNNKPCSTIVTQVNQRLATLQDTVQMTIDTSTVFFVGVKAAPVNIVMYGSAVCPMCKKVYKELYNSVVFGALKGKARIGIKTFTSNPCDLALIAAKKFNKQSELMLSLAPIAERITLPIVLQMADSLGIPRKQFEKEINEFATEDESMESWKEAVGNGVTMTPSIFINGHFYNSYKDCQWIVDAVEYIANKSN